MRAGATILLSTTLIVFSARCEGASKPSAPSYPIVGTAQTNFCSDTSTMAKPKPGEAFYGQDAQFPANEPSYTDNGDGTVTDNVTGLMWQRQMGEKISFDDAAKKAKASRVGGHTDWRVPTIKELFSLIDYTGRAAGERAGTLYLDTKYFEQPLGDAAKGERPIDAQTWSSTQYVGRTMHNDETVFGVNFIDGRIKGYPKFDPRTHEPKKMYFRLVRGNTAYGQNKFIDNHDGTVTDAATGLMWQKADSGSGMDWKTALKYAETLRLAGRSDWRVPTAKELQSIVDYTRSPQTTHSAAIDPVFQATKIKNPEGRDNWAYYWSSTTHLEDHTSETQAAYVAFGMAEGKMFDTLMDVHGAGAVRSDPKSGSAKDYPQYQGPQGDERVVFNMVRCVRYAGTEAGR